MMATRPDNGGSSSGSAIKVMVVGDSISHGREGDWTWRFRISEWFRQEAVPVTFVGPYKGTVPPDEPEPPRPPPLASEPPRSGLLRTDGGYAKGVSPAFLANPDHFAASGRQAMQAKDLIAEQVAAYQPDICLVELGFNDIAWWVSGPHDTLASMAHLVEEARSVKPDLKFAIANVPHRTFIPGREDLPVNTDVYNTLLARAIPRWSTPKSPIALVRFCENYSCGENMSDAAYDGLHPNALGDFQLAQAFTRTLVADFNIGQRELSIPATIPPRPTPTPSDFKAVTAPSGIVVTWKAVYGAYWYDLRVRLAGSDNWETHYVSSTRYDTTLCMAGQRWEYQVRARGGDTVKSPWSAVVSAIANPQTSPAPPRIVTHATAKGFRISWDPFPSRVGVERYGVYAFDYDIPGSFPYGVGIRGSGGDVDGLVPGHHYGVAVQTWTAAGGGLLGGARAITVGRGTPLPPTALQISVLSRTSAELRWRGDPTAAGYRVFARGTGAAGKRSSEPRELCDVATESKQKAAADSHSLVGKALLTGLIPSVWDFEYAVSAYNGNDESDVSQWIVAPPMPTLVEGDSLHIDLEYSQGVFPPS